MHGKPRPPERLRRGLILLTVLLLACWPRAGTAKELRRSLPYVRPLLMGDAGTAAGDESGLLFYNPATISRLEEKSIEAFSIQFLGDEVTSGVLLDEDDLKDEYGDLTPSGLADLVGTSLYMQLSLRLPIVVDPVQGSAYGLALDYLADVEVLEAAPLPFLPPLPYLHLETFLDQVVFYGSSARLGDYVSVGATVKWIKRAGLDKNLDTLTLFSGSSTLELENDPDFRALQDGKTYIAWGLDLGMIVEIPGSPNWRPRLGLSVLNIGDHDSKRGWLGMEFGERPTSGGPPIGGELPLNVQVGFAVSPTYANIRYTFALDLVDAAKTAIPGDSLNNRTRAGFEIGVAPHKDGTALFSVLFGWNATHFSVGVLSRVWVFEIGFGRYTVERGEKPGDNPQERRVVLIGLRF